MQRLTCETDNYIIAGALDGGTQVISFILNFAVFGAAGTEVDCECFVDFYICTGLKSTRPSPIPSTHRSTSAPP